MPARHARAVDVDIGLDVGSRVDSGVGVVRHVPLGGPPVSAATTRRPVDVRRATVLLLVVTTLLWVALLTLWALVTPLFGAPGETDTVDAVFRTALGAGWPPPGSMHALAASRWVIDNPGDRSTFAAVLAAHPGETSIVNPLSQNPQTWFLAAGAVLRVLHFETLRWDLAVLALRLVDVVLLAPVPVLVWAIARRLSGIRLLAAIAPVLMLAIPKAAQFGAAVTIWTAVVLLATVAVWLAARVLTGDRSWWASIGLALVAGAAATLNAMGLVLLGFALVVLVVARRPRARRLVDTAVAVVVDLVVVLALWRSLRSGWVPDGAPAPATPPADVPGGLNIGTFLDVQWRGGIGSFWGSLGLETYGLTPPLVTGLSATALGLLVWAALRRDRALRPTWTVLVWPASVVVATLVYAWRNAVADGQIATSNGSVLLVAAPVLAAAFAVVTASVWPARRTRRRAAVVGTIGSVLIAGYGLAVGVAGAYQGGRLTPTTAGLHALAAATPLGIRPVAAVGLVVVVAAVALVTLVVLATRPAHQSEDTVTGTAADAGPAADPDAGAAGETDADPGHVAAQTTDDPADGAPLDSPPTVEPTRRNNA
ncbi:hypothetical protein ACLBWP_08185 [Microbacterium sp. M1A1_1b]